MDVKKRTKEEAWYTTKAVKLWRESPMYWTALRKQKKDTNQYQCEKCERIFKLREVQVDHIKPKIDPKTGWVDIATFMSRLNCPPEDLQVLCADSCHIEKTGKENKERK